MGKFRIADMDVRWSGIDDTTPPGHCLAVGFDRSGVGWVWLFYGPEPSDDGYRGKVLLPKDSTSESVPSYGPTGAYLRSGRDQANLLKRIAQATTTESTEEKTDGR